VRDIARLGLTTADMPKIIATLGPARVQALAAEKTQQQAKERARLTSGLPASHPDDCARIQRFTVEHPGSAESVRELVELCDAPRPSR
jgi:hypothetical protein